MPWWLVFGVWALLGGVFWLQVSISEREGEWRTLALDWGPWLLMAPLVIWLATRLPIEQRTWRWTIPLHVLFSLALILALGAAMWKIVPQFRPLRIGRDIMTMPMPPPEGLPAPDEFPREHGFRAEGGPPMPPTGPGEGRGVGGPRRDFMIVTRGPGGPGSANRPVLQFFILARGRSQLLFYWSLVAMAHAVRYHRRSVQREKEALAAETRLAEARLIALQAQLQPHFLFNTLNAISSLVYTKPAAADSMICSLSDLLRRVLVVSKLREVPLADELSMTRSYVAIQQVRFSESLEVHWDVPENLANAAVPTLLLQPLVENAVVHAVEAQNGRGAITVRVALKDSHLHFDVTDSGAGKSAPPKRGPDKPVGIGLSNTRERLQALYGANHRFDFSFEPGAGARVHIEIPYRPMENR